MKFGKKIWRMRLQVFFTADSHFGHARTARQRGFLAQGEQDPEAVASGVAAQDEWLVHTWNETVPREATVFHLGDIFLRGTSEYRRAIFDRLHGSKHLVIGNHDHGIDQSLQLPWASPPEHRRFLEIDGDKLVLDHYAGKSWAGSSRGSLQLHGHSHGRMPPTRQSCDVGVDVWGRPVTMTEIRPFLSRQPALHNEDADDDYDPPQP
jgi:calcineurin-like phosphoesterase family protein